MAEIRIETKPVVDFFGNFLDQDHLYLVLVNDGGQEFVIRGGPANDNLLNFGNIAVEVGVPINSSEDRRVDDEGNPLTREDRFSRLLNLNGRDALDVWNIMLQQAQDIGAENIDYNAFFGAQNSNSTVASVLNSVGIDVNTVLPRDVGFPGIDNLLDIPTALVGTNEPDIIRGAAGEDTISGNGGNDIIFGDGDNDTLDGGEDEDTSAYQGNFDNYQLEFLEDGSVRVTDNTADRDGVDVLTNFELAQFSDRTIDIRPAQDIAFVIDTTGSMFDDIDAVKARSGDILDAIFDIDGGSINSRIAVVGYNDPATNTFLSFTNQPLIEERETAATNAINSITVGGGGDFPEAVNAGLIRALNGGAGEWREEAAVRRIILFGDAPPKDTDLRSEVLRLAADVGVESVPSAPSLLSTNSLSIPGEIETSMVTEGLAVTAFELETLNEDGSTTTSPVEIFTILIGDDATTRDDFQSLSSATGGGFFTAADSTEIVDALITAIESPESPDIPDIPDEETTDGQLLEGDGTPNDISGGDGDDTINGRGGNDTLTGGNGNDLIDGGARDDILDGNNGSDTLLGGSGQDSLDGGIGNDSLDGGAQNDQLLGQEGDDTLLGGNGQDSLDGGIGNDSLVGGAQDDQLLGQDGDDTLLGDAGQDTLSGGIGNDSLIGGAGADLLSGQDGDDTLLGGFGSDTFVLSSETGTDIISDFGTGNDVIGLSRGLTFADLSFAGNDIIFGDETLATFTGFDTTTLSEGQFVTI